MAALLTAEAAFSALLRVDSQLLDAKRAIMVVIDGSASQSIMQVAQKLSIRKLPLTVFEIALLQPPK